MRQYFKRAVPVLLTSGLLLAMATEPAVAEPTADEIAPPLPAVVPAESDWQPKFPYPYDNIRNEVTETDVNAEREMCQWYDAQYEALIAQVERFDDNLARNNGDYNVAGNQQIADAVTANLDQAVAFLTPRAQSLTKNRNNFGDEYFTIYQGETFYWLWQQLSNVAAGIHGRQPAWFVGPSLQRAKRWGSRIHRSDVCE